jgi:hypothetical protein
MAVKIDCRVFKEEAADYTLGYGTSMSIITGDRGRLLQTPARSSNMKHLFLLLYPGQDAAFSGTDHRTCLLAAASNRVLPNRLRVSIKASVHSHHKNVVSLPRRPPASDTLEDNVPEDPAEDGFQNPTSILDLVNAKAVSDHTPKRMTNMQTSLLNQFRPSKMA